MDEDAVLNAGAEPQSAVGTFKIAVSLNGVHRGWMVDGGGTENWVTLTPDETKAGVWEQVAYDGAIYYRLGSNNYLSYRSRGASALGVKMRGWTYAAKWELQGTKLFCADNKEFLGMDGDYFYVNSQNEVDVKFVE